MSTVSKIFKPGDVVLNGCQPFVIQVIDDQRDIRCHYCLNISENLMSCGQCHLVKYCSKKCQKLDWKDIHKFNECKLLQKFDDIECNDVERIVIRLVMKVTFDQKSRQRVYRLWDNRERRVDDLISHKDKIDRNEQCNFEILAQYLCDKFDELFGVKLTTEEVWHWFGVYSINNMTVGNEFSGEIGNTDFATAVYVDGSALDHDCKPSSVCWFYGRKLQVRAMRTIDTSVEQPTMTYISRTKDRDTRRQQLAERYFFECQCKRCVDHTDKDFDFAHYQNLLDNPKIDCIDYWNELLALDRKLFGPHYPNITCELFLKWTAIEETLNNHMSSSLIKEWTDLSEELEKELVITHGEENPLYHQMASHLNQVKLIAKMMKIKID